MIERVFASALVEVKVQVLTPEVSEEVQIDGVLLPVPIAVKTGVIETIGLVCASLRVIVTSEVAELFATTELVPVIVVEIEDADPGVKVTPDV